MSFSFPEGTKMFQFPSFPSVPYVFRYGYLGMTPGEFPHSEILGSVPVERLPEAYRSLATSFIGSWRQGIHRTPLVA
jgi:hypothetical protein